FVVAPGDAEESYFWSGMSLAIAWKYQIPAIILSDKTLAEGVFSFDSDSIRNFPEIMPVAEDDYKEYKRYENTESGVSPLACIPRSKAVIKVNSYEHDEYGITTEDPSITMVMQHKRLRKEKLILHELEDFEPVGVYGNRDADTALICWGSNKGVCCEVGEALGIKIIQPRVLAPFPAQELLKICSGVTKCICVENNALGQLARMCRCSGIRIDDAVLRYDGRPFSIEELTGEIQRIIVNKG
ncbi:MAG: pyruvate ferredoxin oxidoreductase, partial [Candidatus Omnitrophica bacterium]|nr:pyruvate ferredoxin oxidoreductase [Candidatus Omnitrophota bacterium]